MLRALRFHPSQVQISRLKFIGLSVSIAFAVGLLQAAPMLGSSSELYGASSLEELLQLRQELIQSLEAAANVSNPPRPQTRRLSAWPAFFSNRGPKLNQNLLKKLKAVEIQIIVEQRAEDNWQQALRLGARATDPEAISSSYEDQKQAQVLWERAIANLGEIPQQSLMANQADKKLKQYEASLTALNQALDLAESSILERIRQDSGLSRKAMISVCNLQHDCLHLRGDTPPASAASLIKVPVAVALVHKTTEEKTGLAKEVYVEGGNFTEDASSIRARKRYSLEDLMGEMIDHSSNIATNQLIDYVGQKYINALMEKEGYETMRVRSKLVGNRIRPFRFGKGRNRITSRELTEMMIKIYNYEYPESEALIRALEQQYDHEMGHDGLKDLESVEWLGEKTGQNSRVVGTTFAADIDGETYIFTVIDNSTGHIPQIRRATRQIAEYILQKGHL
ncbi:MAG: serine hydrolase [Microcoleaceae cyanobacterium]